jgi:hypothetical protein
MPAKWNVWSLDLREKRGLVVDEGTQGMAEAAAEQRNASAIRLKVAGLAFVALPDGQVPSAEDYPEPTPVPQAPVFEKLPPPGRFQENWRIVSNRDYEGAFDLESTRGNGTTQTALTVADLIALGTVVHAKIAELLLAAAKTGRES